MHSKSLKDIQSLVTHYSRINRKKRNRGKKSHSFKSKFAIPIEKDLVHLNDIGDIQRS